MWGLGRGLVGLTLSEHCANKGKVSTQSIPHLLTPCSLTLNHRVTQCWAISQDNEDSETSSDLKDLLIRERRGT